MQVWILEVGDANNVSYDVTRRVYKNFENARQAMVDEFKVKMSNCDYSEEEIQEHIEDPAVDAEGNEMLYDDEGEFYLKVVEGTMEEK